MGRQISSIICKKYGKERKDEWGTIDRPGTKGTKNSAVVATFQTSSSVPPSALKAFWFDF